MNVVIREGCADDAQFLAWDMLTAARSHKTRCIWDYAFPGPEQFRLDHLAALAVAEPQSFSHFSSFLVAESDGKPVGALSGFDPTERGLGLFTTALASVLSERGWSDEHQGLLLERIGPTISCNPETPEGHWVIEWVAVKPQARGTGVIDRLLQAVLGRGRERGFERAQLGVLLGNTPALRAYGRAGFQVHDEKRDPAFEAAVGCPGIARMVCDLKAQA